MATPTRWPHRFVRRPPSSSTTAPASGNTSSSQAARCTPAAARGTSVGTAAARAATAVRVPVTPTPLCWPRSPGGRPPGALVLARGDDPPDPLACQYLSRFASSPDADRRAPEKAPRNPRPPTPSPPAPPPPDKGPDPPAPRPSRGPERAE